MQAIPLLHSIGMLRKADILRNVLSGRLFQGRQSRLSLVVQARRVLGEGLDLGMDGS